MHIIKNSFVNLAQKNLGAQKGEKRGMCSKISDEKILQQS